MTGAEALALNDMDLVFDVVGDALDDQLAQSRVHLTDGLLPGAGVDNQLAQQSVIVGGDGEAAPEKGVEPHRGAAGHVEHAHRSRGGGVDPALQGGA